MTARARARLAWWLGPWAPRAVGPADVERTALPVGGGSYLYRRRGEAPSAARAGVECRDRTGTPVPARSIDDTGLDFCQPCEPPRVAWLISPGLHPAGPDDPRVDRFARVLAAAGGLVLSPRSPTLTGLQLGAGAITDLATARAALAALPDARGLPVRIASLSVGSLAALHLAADPAAAITRTVLLGGYVDPVAVVRAMCGADPVPRDPTNQPTVMMTFADHLPIAIADRPALVAAWAATVRAIWAVPAWTRPGSVAHHDVVRGHAAAVTAADRHLFLMGCTLEPGGHALAVAAQARPRFDYLELRPLLPAITGELVAFHGPGDAVVPVEQLDVLHGAAPRARVHRLAGLAHGGPHPLRELLAGLAPRALAAELRGFAALIDALAP